MVTPPFGFYVFTLEPAPHTQGYIHAIVFIMEIQAFSQVLRFPFASDFTMQQTSCKSFKN